jgi:hypothetical protein
MLAQHALGFDISGHNFHIKEKPMQKEENKLSHAQIYSIEIWAVEVIGETPIICYLWDQSAKDCSSAWTLFKQKW